MPILAESATIFDFSTRIYDFLIDLCQGRKNMPINLAV